MAFAFMTDHASLAVAVDFEINVENFRASSMFYCYRFWVIAIVEMNRDLP